MSGVASYTLCWLRAQEHTRVPGTRFSVTRGRGSCAGHGKNYQKGTLGVSELAGRRFRFVDLAHLVTGCCEWYSIVLRAS
eukprot:2759756-Rhodomonas_salina.1